MIGVVLDTNIVISALLKPTGAEANVFRLALHGTYLFYVSEEVLREYEDVARRPKFKRTQPTVTALLKSIRNSAEIVVPSRRLSISKDDSDNRFLEAAEAAQADYLVTGNKRHFPKRLGVTRIVTARELIELTMPPER